MHVRHAPVDRVPFALGVGSSRDVVRAENDEEDAGEHTPSDHEEHEGAQGALDDTYVSGQALQVLHPRVEVPHQPLKRCDRIFPKAIFLDRGQGICAVEPRHCTVRPA